MKQLHVFITFLFAVFGCKKCFHPISIRIDCGVHQIKVGIGAVLIGLHGSEGPDGASCKGKLMLAAEAIKKITILEKT